MTLIVWWNTLCHVEEVNAGKIRASSHKVATWLAPGGLYDPFDDRRASEEATGR